MISLRRPPTFMPGMPSVQPGMTLVQSPEPWALASRITQSGVPRGRLESNSVPFASQPVYWAWTVAPFRTVSPVPGSRSMNWRPSGNFTGFRPAPSLKLSTTPVGVGVVVATPPTGPLLAPGAG